MGAYRFQLPPGWVAAPLSPTDSGLLIVPEEKGAAVLVLYAVAATGTLHEELARLQELSCRDLEILERGEVAEFRTQLAGIISWARVRDPQQGREHSHLYALVQSEAERVPVLLLAGPLIAESHRDGFRLVLSTLVPNPDPAAAPLSCWAD